LFTPNAANDTVALGAAQQPWPNPADHPQPSSLDAYASASKLIASGLFALVLALMIGEILRESLASDQPYQGWRLWLRIGAAIGIAGLGIVILLHGIKAVVRPQAAVAMSPAGLAVPGIYTRPVPWSEIAAVVHDKPKVKIFGPGTIVLGIRDGGRFGRVEGPELKPARAPGELDVATLPQMLTVPVPRLLAAVEAHRAHYGNA